MKIMKFVAAALAGMLSMSPAYSEVQELTYTADIWTMTTWDSNVTSLDFNGKKIDKGDKIVARLFLDSEKLEVHPSVPWTYTFTGLDPITFQSDTSYIYRGLTLILSTANAGVLDVYNSLYAEIYIGGTGLFGRSPSTFQIRGSSLTSSMSMSLFPTYVFEQNADPLTVLTSQVNDTLFVWWDEGNPATFGSFGAIWQYSPSPVPEPSTYLMLLTGIGLLGTFRRLSRQI
jgi:hypothetical protein